jgi:hypothetical protein
METFQITLMPYYVKTKKSSKTPTLEEIDEFMMSYTGDRKQYEAIIRNHFDYGSYDYTMGPHNIEYIPGGFITFQIGNEVSYSLSKKIDGKVVNGYYKQSLTKETVVESLLEESLEDGAYEGDIFVYTVNGQEMGVFDYRKPKCIRIVSRTPPTKSILDSDDFWRL